MTPISILKRCAGRFGRSRSAMWLAPPLLCLLGLLLTWQLHRHQVRQELTADHALIKLLQGQLGSRLEGRVNAGLRPVRRLMQEEHFRQGDLTFLKSDFQIPLPETTSLQLVGRVDVEGALIGAVKKAGESGALADGTLLVQQPAWRDVFAAAKTTTHILAVHRPADRTVLVIAPMRHDGNFVGAYFGVLSFAAVVDEVFDETIKRQFNARLFDPDQRQVYATDAQPDLELVGPSDTTLTLFDRTWKLRLTPTAEFASVLPPQSSTWLLLGGLGLSLLVPALLLWITVAHESQTRRALSTLEATQALNTVSAQLMADEGHGRQIIKLLAERARTAFNMPMCSVMLLEENREYIEVVHRAMADPIEQVRYAMRDLRATSACIETGQVLICNDVEQNPGLFHVEILRSLNIRSAVLLPLVVRGRAIGLLCLNDSRPREFSDAQRRMMELWSTQAAVIIGHLQLFDRLRDQLATNKTLLRELNHRVKNNLAGIGGLLTMDQPALSRDAQDWLDRVSHRISTMGQAHELFLGAMEAVSIEQLIETTIGSTRAIKPPGVEIQTDLSQAAGTFLPGDTAVTLALALNELCYNALTHGTGTDGKMIVRARRRPDTRLILSVIDIPGSTRVGDSAASGLTQHSTGMGLTLVKGLITRELNGTLKFFDDPAGGTSAQISFLVGVNNERSNHD